MKKILTTILAAMTVCAGANAQGSYVPTKENLANRAQFQDDKFGMFIHWGVYSMLASGEWVLNSKKIKQEEYAKLASGFSPSKFDAAAWVAAVKDAGMKYIVITSRHHDGFSMFGTKQSPYNIVDATPFGRDIIKELAAECRKQGVRLGFYYSELDWGRPDYNPLGRTGQDTGRTPSGTWDDYLGFMNRQITELLTAYGPVNAMWFDGMWDKPNADW
ncbi:MAG: alpha-L-fucosidase, partial [Rikenellaceae bacterium]|nr:alpha-L-fucosidase [Rikenellaceae bacterium]